MKKVIRIIENVLEMYIPMCMFALMFIVFVLGIVFRYIIRRPLTWSIEFVSICFLEMVLMAACYVQRIDKHVKFSMIVDMMPPRLQSAAGCVTNLVLMVCFACVLKPSAEYVLFLNGVSATPVFKIGLHIIYFPFLIFLILQIVYAARNFLRELMVVIGKSKASERSEEE